MLSLGHVMSNLRWGFEPSRDTNNPSHPPADSVPDDSFDTMDAKGVSKTAAKKNEFLDLTQICFGSC